MIEVDGKIYSEQEVLKQLETLFVGNGESISTKSNIKLLPESTVLPEQLTSYDDIPQPPIDYIYLSQLVERNSTHKGCMLLKKNLTVGLGYESTNEKLTKAQLDKWEDFKKNPNNRIEEDLREIFNRLAFDWEYAGGMAIEIVQFKGLFSIFHANIREIFPRVNKSGEVIGYYQVVYGGLNNKKFFQKFNPLDKNTRSQMIVLRKYCPSSRYYSIPDYYTAIKAITTNDIFSQFCLNFFDNSARPDFLLALIGSSINDKNLGILQTMFANYKGVSNAHRGGIITIDNPQGDAKILKFGGEVNNDFRNEKNDNRDEIAQIHGVPPKILGISSSGSLGSGNEAIGALKIFKEAIISPQQVQFESFFNKIFTALLGFDPKMVFYKINLDSEKDIAIVIKTLTECGLISVNEGREKIAYQKINDKKFDKVEPLAVTISDKDGNPDSVSKDNQIDDNSMSNLDPTANGEGNTQRNE